MSPATARADTLTSAPVARAAPTTARPTPSQVALGTGIPRRRAISAAHTGWVATRAVAVATLVSFALGTHVPKCPARANPASTDNSPARRPSPGRNRSASWWRRPAIATGAMTPTARALRQNAIASAGAAAPVAIAGRRHQLADGRQAQ